MESDLYGDYGAWVWRANAESRFNWWKARDCVDTGVRGYLRRRRYVKDVVTWESGKRPTINITMTQEHIHHAVIGDSDVQISFHGMLSTVRTYLSFRGDGEVEIVDWGGDHRFPKHQLCYRFFGMFPEHQHMVAHYIAPEEQYLVAVGWGLGDLIPWKGQDGHIIQFGGRPPWHGDLPTEAECLDLCRKHFGV